VRQLIEDDRLLFVMQLEREAQVGPLNNWPDGYASWVVSLLLELKAARADREQGELSAIRTKAARG